MLVAVVAGVIVGTRPETEAAAPAQTVSVPLFTSASSAGVQSFVRIINHSGDAGTAAIEAIDDDGASYGPLDLAIRAGEAVHLDAGDLEDGDTGKGLSRSTGPGSGSWRLAITSALDLEVLPYVRASDGFVTGMQDLVPYTRTGYRVALFHPASNARQVSRLRLSNPGGEPAAVTIEGVDDAGSSPGTAVRLTLAAGTSRTLSAQDLETGEADGLSGALGDGTGRWRLTINASEPLLVLNLVAGSATGRVSNLSSMPANVADGDDGATTLHAVPWLPSASREDLSGLVRVINHTDQAGIVAIEAFDDSGTKYGPVRLFVRALGARHFDAAGLEAGDIRNGLVGSTGSGTGDWRLQLRSTLELEVLSYVHAPGGEDGLLSGMYDVVPRSGAGHRVTVFDPDRVPGAAADSDDGPGQVSQLRLINPGETPATVTITGTDGDGEAPETAVRLSLAAGTSRTVTVPELEAGEAEGLSGALGDGAGRWHLEVRSNRRIQVMHLLSGPSGDVANLSTAPGAPGAGLVTTGATAITATASELFGEHISEAIVQGRCVTCHVEGGVSGNTRLVFKRSSTTDHEALNLAAFERFLSEVESGASVILNKVQGVSHGGGAQVPAGSAGFAHLERFLERLDGPSALFSQHISEPVVQSRCIACHVAGGVSGNTRLVFAPSTTADHEALNLATFEDFLSEVESGASVILNKIQGVSHGGGAQVPAGSADFAQMERFLGKLDAEVVPATITVETLFDPVRMAPLRKTLRRAALIFAGRIPTEEEYASIYTSPTALRTTIRNLMTGQAFHDFLIRGANDRLLTDRKGTVIGPGAFFVDLVDQNYKSRRAAVESGDWPAHWNWWNKTQHGFRRAPVELIAHVVEKDLPYTEILTADYIMANPFAAQAYGAPTEFDDSENWREFKPSRIAKYYRKYEGYKSERDDVVGADRVLDPGSLSTIYPHSGILNTTSFLLRYPTTATNRNRARARWTYYHFLGVDIENSASRTMDPVALADTDNPTLLNPACTVCHSVMDPVAGAFQDYGDSGLYKDQWGGMDSLDEFYKYDPPGRKDVLVNVRTREGSATTLGMLHLFAGKLNELGLKNLRTFEGDRKLHIGLGEVMVRDAHGVVVDRYETKDVVAEEDCGNPRDDGYRLWDCRKNTLVLPLTVPRDGSYRVDVEAWVYEPGEQAATLQVWMPGPFYRSGDTWYRTMRVPGFGAEQVSGDADSLQWLARKIVADPRFAEATVKFWWPAIMGRDVAEPPAEEGDADFEGQLLAASAQGAEIRRLAEGLRQGFNGRPRYNLKDLLVEMVLSNWFRADALSQGDRVRAVALRDAGARRLLTPEELAHKTASLTGFQWGRHVDTGCGGNCDALPSNLTDDFRLLYGGIDSDGISERARDMTSVMAGLAKRHAVRTSCPVVAREFFLLPEENRRLFGGIGRSTRPDLRFGASFEIEAASRGERETRSLEGLLAEGSSTVRLTFSNDWDGGSRDTDRNIFLDRLDVRDAQGQVVASYELETVEPRGNCKGPRGGDFALWCNRSLEVPINVLAAGRYTIEIVVWADQAGDELPRLDVIVLDPTHSGSGADAIRAKLVELHDKLLGVQVTPYSPDVEAAFRLFVAAAERRRDTGEDWFNHWDCAWRNDKFFFEGILDDILEERRSKGGYAYFDFKDDRTDAYIRSIDFSDTHYSAHAWVVVLSHLLMDYRYLYL